MKPKHLCLLLALCLLAGCAPSAATEEAVNPITFYYADAAEDYERATGALTGERVDLGQTDLSIAKILDRYLSAGRAPFPVELRCTEVTLRDGVLTVTLNGAFSALGGMELTLAAAALTLTLCQIDGVEGVSIRAEGDILSEDWKDVFTPDDFVLTDTSATNPEYAVLLYFLDEAGLLHAQRRMIACREKTQLPELAMQALLAGPNDTALTQAIPEGTKLLDLTVEGGLCTLVLSEAFAACDTDTRRAEAAVHAVVLTLCALDTVERVQIQLLGGTELEYCPITEPLTPADSWAAQP